MESTCCQTGPPAIHAFQTIFEIAALPMIPQSRSSDYCTRNGFCTRNRRRGCSDVGAHRRIIVLSACTIRRARVDVTQKSAAVFKSALELIRSVRTPAFWYSPTRFSKKFVFP
eukprot:GHVU01025416.1.p1 GENE.GHVU01025416.1~~GHVU01025416.1.p1  ORF type:complete len:113 (-),score=4.86 GHVU01025416.1:90-428(-)